MKASILAVLAVVFALTQAIVVTQKASKYSGRLRKHRGMTKMTPEPTMAATMPSMEPEPSYPVFTPDPMETDMPGITTTPSMSTIPLPSLPKVPSPVASMKPLPSVPKLPTLPVSMMPTPSVSTVPTPPTSVKPYPSMPIKLMPSMTKKPRYKKSMMNRRKDTTEVIEWTGPIVLDMDNYWKRKSSDSSDSSGSSGSSDSDD